MDDLIRRSDAIKAVEERSFAVRDSYTVKAILRNVPSADSEVVGKLKAAIESEEFCKNCPTAKRISSENLLGAMALGFSYGINTDRPQGEVDAIDRDALIEYCLNLIDVERKQGSDVMNYGQERVNQTEAIINYIEHMPHIKADRPQGYWTKTDIATYRCSECGKIQIADDVNELNFCCCCGSHNKIRRMKGAGDESTL